MFTHKVFGTAKCVKMLLVMAVFLCLLLTRKKRAQVAMKPYTATTKIRNFSVLTASISAKNNP